jgi:hypothetical protein
MAISGLILFVEGHSQLMFEKRYIDPSVFFLQHTLVLSESPVARFTRAHNLFKRPNDSNRISCFGSIDERSFSLII